MILDPLFYLAAVPAVALTGVSKGGFGGAFGFAAVPIMALVISPVQAAGLMLPILLVSDAMAVWSYRRCFDWSLIAHLLPAGVAGVAAGWATANWVCEDAVRLLVGVIALVFAGRAWLGGLRARRRRLAGSGDGEAPPQPRRVLGAALWGGLTGYTSFVAHAGGPPYQTYVMPMRLAPVVYAGSTAVYFALLNSTKVIAYAGLGQINLGNLTEAALLAPVAVVSTWAGVRLAHRLRERLFYGMLTWSVALVGIKLVYDGAVHLAGA